MRRGRPPPPRFRPPPPSGGQSQSHVHRRNVDKNVGLLPRGPALNESARLPRGLNRLPPPRRPLPRGPPISQRPLDKKLAGQLKSSNKANSLLKVMEKDKEIEKGYVVDDWVEELGVAKRPAKFAPVPIKDRVSLSLFVAHLCLMVVLSAATYKNEPKIKIMDTQVEQVQALNIFLGSTTISSVLALIFYILVLKFPEKIISYTFVSTCIACFMGGGVSFMYGNTGWSILWILTGLIFSGYTWTIRSRISFASLILEAGAQVMQKHPRTALVAFGGLFLQLCWLFFWTFTYVHAWPILEHNAFIGTLLLLSLLWTVQTIHSAVFTIAAGVTATWYFMFDCMPKNPVATTVRRTVRISLGSVALGSFITSVLKFGRIFLDTVRRSGTGEPSVSVMAAALILRVCEVIMRKFNVFAYTYIAIYGQPFMEASTSAWNILKDCGLDALLNDDIISGCILSAAFLVSSLTGFTAATVAYLYGLEYWFWGVGAPASVIGFIIGVSLLSLVESASITIFVCFAEDPDALQFNDKELYQALSEVQELAGDGRGWENYLHPGSDLDSDVDLEEGFTDCSSDSDVSDEYDPEKLTFAELNMISSDEDSDPEV